MDVFEKAKEILDNVQRYWKELQDKYPEYSSLWKSGFSVFYSPVSQNPQFMLIGINPGGDESCFDETRDSKIPLEHEYFKENYLLAKTMRYIFEKAGLEQELKQSVKTNLNFFRSKGEKQWNEIEANLKKEIESFCEKRIKEFIEVAKPRVIFCEAFSVLERLLKILNQETSQLMIDYRSSKPSNRLYRLYQSFKFKDFYVNGIIGIPHPTGSVPRLSKNEEEKRKIAELLKEDAKILLQ
ncbi:MAG: hypothetical protein LWW95_01785 [Candidatus Desulfofervidus auxilii]|nr:hypothetical protein [Candidatus Desulfofervidus auxilii]